MPDKQKYNLAIYVHDLVREIGHSRALIETINNMSKDSIDNIFVIAFTCDSNEIIYREEPNKVKFIRVPSLFLNPFLIKMFYFYIMSFYMKLINVPKNTKHVGIGTAALCVDYVNIQFIQDEWRQKYFTIFQGSFLKYIYKRMLFFFFSLSEIYLYKIRKNVKFSVLSKFEMTYLNERFNVDKSKMTLNYSGVNLENFSLSEKSRQEIYIDLLTKYPELTKIDIAKPINLFIGAFERKGLHRVLEVCSNEKEAQLIVIGKPEGSISNFDLPNNIAYIPFTKEVQNFYAISDNFIFPTIYEPFGLVLLEAAVMGLNVYSLSNKVGASELLENLNGVYLFENQESLTLNSQEIISKEKRELYRRERLERFAEYTWEAAGKRFQRLLEDKSLS